MFADPLLLCATVPPCRLVVRFTNRNVVCQVAYATMAGDKVICAAYRCVGIAKSWMQLPEIVCCGL
jgi:ribosomal protein L18